MSERCDLDACSLKEDIGEIKRNQEKQLESHNKMITAQAVLIEKIGNVVKQHEDDNEDNEKQHNILFGKVRYTVKWAHLGTVVFVLGTIVTIVWKFATAGGP